MNTQNKKIGLLSAIVIQTNAMIGAGIVAIPAILAQKTGSLGLLSYVICILIIFCMTFSLGELSLLHGGHAWCYRFPSIWGKHIAGMIASSCYVLGVLISMGFVAKQAGVWLHEIIPFLSSNILCFLITGILSAFVYAGKNVSSFWQYVYSAFIFLGIIIMTIICFMNFDRELFFTEYRGDISSILMVTPMLLFSFLGFESISSLYAIVKNPRKNVLVGGIIGVICVGILYVTFSSSVIGSINPKYFLGSGDHSLATVLTNAFPKFHVLSNFIYLGGLFAIIGTLHSMIWSVSVLLLDVIQRSKNKKITILLGKQKLNINHVTLFSCLGIMTSSLVLKNEVIMNMAVLLLAISYIFSIMSLFLEKTHYFMNRLICITGVFGGFLMVIFSLYSLIKNFT